jgi:hypothetical protein
LDVGRRTPGATGFPIPLAIGDLVSIIDLGWRIEVIVRLLDLRPSDYKLERRFVGPFEMLRWGLPTLPALSNMRVEIVVLAVAGLVIPQSLKAVLESGVVEVTIGILGIEPGGAQIAKVGVAPEAYHVVAALGLLRGRVACSTRPRPLLDVFERGLFLFGHFIGVTLEAAAEEFAMPRLITTRAKGEAAVLADAEKILGLEADVLSRGLSRSIVAGRVGLGSRVEHVFVIVGFAKLKTVGLLVSLRLRGPVAPFPGAVDGRLVGL